MKTDHFGGKTVIEHLRETRVRGALAAEEIHGTEAPGCIAAGADAAKETTFVLAMVFLLFHPEWYVVCLVGAAFFVWKVGRSASLGWARLERLHRLIEQERWEIEHDRESEEQELRAMYRAKGFSGRLLDDVVSLLSSDDNRMLRIMLEEEMGLTLEAYEHPLKQAMGAGIGVAIGAGVTVLMGFFGVWGVLSSVFLIVTVATYLMARLEKNQIMEALVWSWSISAFGLLVVILLQKLW